MNVARERKIYNVVGNALQFALVQTVDGGTKFLIFCRCRIANFLDEIGRFFIFGVDGGNLIFYCLQIECRKSVLRVFIEQIERKRHGIFARIVIKSPIIAAFENLLYGQAVQEIDGGVGRQRCFDVRECQRGRIEPHLAAEC